MSNDVTALAAQVQRNCDISDSLHAREYTLCIYLLKMREYFRWEKGYGYGDRLPKDELGQWLTDRENLWEELQGTGFEHIEVGGNRFNPFESEPINRSLKALDLAYSGGYGSAGRPHFFLGERVEDTTLENRPVLVVGREYARDITAPPAMVQDGAIFVRRESLKRMLWERLEEWQWQKRENAMARAARFYDFDTDFDAALNKMTERETQTLLLHELGEIQAGEHLGPDWEEMLISMGRSRAELVARAARDHLADCLVTLPGLMEREALSSLHFYFANLSGVRKSIFPELINAYAHWSENGTLKTLRRTVEDGRSRWQEVTGELLSCYREEQPQSGPCFDRLVANFGV